MADFLQLPDRRYSVIYADPPWAYRQCGATEKSRGNAAKHYQTMTTAEICAMPVPSICAEGAACFMWATFPNIGEAIKAMEAWGFTYKTAAFVWVKKNRKNGGTFGEWEPTPAPMRRCACWACHLDLRPGADPQSQGPPGHRGPF